MATQAQMDANRRNASHSTGPKTDEGKERSRANAATHGLTSKIVLPEALEAAQNQRYAEWQPAFHLEDVLQEHELRRAVLASLRIEHCQSCEIERRVELAQIARDSGPQWDKNRQEEAACLGKTLKRDPEIVAIQLRQTPAGRAWLIGQWNHLLLGVEVDGAHAWSDVESNRALDLMGKQKTLRPQLIKFSTPFADPITTRKLILDQIAQLEAEQVHDAAENDRFRSVHIHGLITDSDAKLKLIRRYETEAQRRYDRSIASLRKAKTTLPKPPKINPEPAPAAKPAATEPHCETKPIPVVVCSGTVVVEPVAKPEVPQPGNRKFRRLMLKTERHQAFLQRSKP